MKVAELTGSMLDYWVAKIEGLEIELGRDGKFHGSICEESGEDWYHFSPSTEWHQGGPIIARENIQLGPPTQRVHRNGGPHAGWGESGIWSACTWHNGANGRRSIAHHENSPLIAAMRCFVASKYGAEVPEAIAA